MMWLDQSIEFCNGSMKSCLHDNDIKVYPPQRKGKMLLLKDSLER